MCFVNDAVYPVIERGGRQVRPRLIFKVNCKRVNMFKKFLAKISKFLCRSTKPKNALGYRIAHAGEVQAIKTPYGYILVQNISSGDAYLTFYE